LQLLRSVSLHPNINLLYGLTKGVIKKYKLQEIPYASLNNKKRLGRGGFGTVYRAKFSSLGYVAIKEVESDTDEKAQKLFINE
ncbi:24028_t:CDS:2, partial [Gigaspora margarita]